MNYQETTQVANVIFDKYVPLFKPSEILILLIVIRQTIGWYNYKTEKRKYRDWISNKQFQKKTGLSNKAVSNAIHTLITENLIEATNKQGKILDTPRKRKGNLRTFYRCLLYTNVKKTLNPVYKVHITKLTNTKQRNRKSKKTIAKRLTDIERYQQIVNDKSHP